MARKMLGVKNSLNKYRYLVGIDEVGRGPLAGPVTVCAFCIDTHKISVKKLVTELNLALLMQVTQMKKDQGVYGKTYKKRTIFDSKSITEDIREKIAQHIYMQCKRSNIKSARRNKENEEIQNVGIYISIKDKTAHQIDTKGIAVCIRELVAEVLVDICKHVHSIPNSIVGGIQKVHGSNIHNGNIHSGIAASTVNYEHTESLHVHNFDKSWYEQAIILLDGGLHAPSQYMHQKTIIKGDAKESLIGIASILAKVHRDTYMKKISKKYPQYGFEVHKGYGTKFHRDTIRNIGSVKLHRKSFLKNLNNF